MEKQRDFVMPEEETVGAGSENPPESPAATHPPLGKGGTPSATATDPTQGEPVGLGNDYPSVACGDTSPDKERQEENVRFSGEPVGAGVPDRPSASDDLSPDQPECGPVPESSAPHWYVDLNREEFVHFRMLLARVNGPLRLRVPTLVMALICCATMVALAIEEWYTAGMDGTPDPVMLVGALLVLVPAAIVWWYIPAKMRKTAGEQYDRAVNSGMNYCGRLTVCPEYVEKAGDTATAHLRLDERVLFIESAEMMVFTAAGSPALVLPARCLTQEMVAAIHAATQHLPPRNRRFIARIAPMGRVVTAPPPAVKPEELFVTTFTYSPEEYAKLLRELLIRNFWRASPVTAVTATCGAVLFGYDQQNLLMTVVYFLIIAAILTTVNLLLPLARVKNQSEALSPHQRTVQVRMDTLALRIKGQTGSESFVLWCDVDHVYDKDEFVEVVHDKHGTLHIPKRAIENLTAFEAVLNRCRGK